MSTKPLNKSYSYNRKRQSKKYENRLLTFAYLSNLQIPINEQNYYIPIHNSY